MNRFIFALLAFLAFSAFSQERTSSGGASLAGAFIGAQTLYVDPNGSDTAAQRGVSIRPWQTIDAAASNALAGDTILVAQGTYRTTNGIFLPKGGAKLIGIGKPIIENWATNLATLKNFGVVLTDNSTVDSFTISNMQKSVIYQLAIGAHHDLNWGNTLTNVVLKNLFLDGDSDAFFVKGTNRISVDMYDCVAVSKWDAMVMIANGPAVFKWRLFNCVSVIYTESIFTPGMSGYTHAVGMDGQTSAGSSLEIYGGFFASTNNTRGQVVRFIGGVCDFLANGATFIGTNWFQADDFTTSKIRVTGGRTSGKFFNGSLDTVGDVAVLSDKAWALPNGLTMVDNLDAVDFGSFWTNAWPSDGGLTLGSTNSAGGNGKLRVESLATNQLIATAGNKALTNTGIGFIGYQSNSFGGVIIAGTNGNLQLGGTNVHVSSSFLRSGFVDAQGHMIQHPYWTNINLGSGEVTGKLPITSVDWTSGGDFLGDELMTMGASALKPVVLNIAGNLGYSTSSHTLTARSVFKKTAMIQASGAAVTGSTVVGDSATSANSSSGVAATSTEGATRDEVSTTTIGSSYGTSGNQNYRTGRNIYFATSAKLGSTATQRTWYGLTDQTISTMGGADNPAGNYAAFRQSTNDTFWQCITKDGTTQSIKSSGVTINTAIHKFEITFNDSVPNVVFSIDGSTVATNTANLPSAATNLRFSVGGNIFDAGAHHVLYEYIYVESDR